MATSDATFTTPARARFRELLARPGIVSQPVIFDPLGARIAEEVGFEGLGLGGYALGAHLASSEPLLSLEDVAAVTRRITSASSLPLMVDAGAGWGEPVHVMHTVRVLEHAGAASIHIEDQIFPKRVHYHKGIEHVVDEVAMVSKIKAAVAARRDPNFVIVARTDAMRTDGYDEGIRRANLYVEAGAEVVMLFPNNADEARRTPQDLPGVPLVYVNSTGNRLGRGVFGVDELEAWGWKFANDAITTINVVARAMRESMVSLKESGEPGVDAEEMVRVRKQIEDTIGLDEYYRIEEETVELAG
jgi:2-methylisocitrate lyase-like PEP mutase family enzyme